MINEGSTLTTCWIIFLIQHAAITRACNIPLCHIFIHITEQSKEKLLLQKWSNSEMIIVAAFIWYELYIGLARNMVHTKLWLYNCLHEICNGLFTSWLNRFFNSLSLWWKFYTKIYEIYALLHVLRRWSKSLM